MAAAIIWLVGGASLLLIAAARTPAARVNCALAALLVRMSLPLAAVVYFSRADHPLARHGVVSLIVVHYLAGLALETWFAVRLASSSVESPPKNQPAVVH